jgi:hypothetical protein
LRLRRGFPVAKRGIKVKDLARELGLTSRVLIERCRAEGLAVQNSITRLNHEAEARARAWFKSSASGIDKSEASPKA